MCKPKIRTQKTYPFLLPHHPLLSATSSLSSNPLIHTSLQTSNPIYAPHPGNRSTLALSHTIFAPNLATQCTNAMYKRNVQMQDINSIYTRNPSTAPFLSTLPLSHQSPHPTSARNVRTQCTNTIYERKILMQDTHANTHAIYLPLPSSA